MNIFAVVFLTLWTSYTSIEYKVKFIMHLIENNREILYFDDQPFNTQPQRSKRTPSMDETEIV